MKKKQKHFDRGEGYYNRQDLDKIRQINLTGVEATRHKKILI